MKGKRFARYGKFAVFLVVMGVFGAFSQVLLHRYDNQLLTAGAAVMVQLRQNGAVITAALFLLFAGGSLLFSRKARRLLASLGDSADQKPLDIAAAASQGFATVGEIIMILLLGLFTAKETRHMLVVILLCICGMFTLMILEIRSISLQKKISPEKKGDPLNLHFEKDWIDSCDEAEKYVTYRASFQSLMLLKKVLGVFLCLTIIAHLALDIGPLPFLTVGALWLVQIVSYLYYSVQLFGKHIS